MDASDPDGDWTMRKRFEAELAPGEKILWSGRPARRGLDGGTIFGIVGSLIWFPIFNWIMIVQERFFDGLPSFAIVLWIVTMSTIVLGYVAGFPIMRHWFQRHTGYALTNRRVLAMVLDSKGMKKHLRSEAIELVGSERIHLGKDGTGTLEFARSRLLGGKVFFMPELIYRQATSPLGFVEIEDGQAVFQQFLMARDCIRGTGGQPG
jgi:hypothetical protein